MNRHVLFASTALALASLPAFAGDLAWTSVSANPREDGKTAEDILSPEIKEVIAAKGDMKLENPSDHLSHYGYGSDGPMAPAAGDVQAKGHNVEATKTEPDKNTYLVLDGQKGPDAAYNYGSHFLFQGHENAPVGTDSAVYGGLTRINLDADDAHRVTLMQSKTVDGRGLPMIDGSTWDPFARVLLLTSEEGTEGGVWSATTDFPSTVRDISTVTGRASYEGVQLASDGSVWLVEDNGGKGGDKTKNAKQPNSFIYRLIPTDKADLSKGGKLEVLQVIGTDGQPMVFHKGQNDADILSDGMKALHTYGNSFKTKWVTVHDTAQNTGTSPADTFDANEAAKAAGGTPFKRPENAQFRPGSGFKEYFFTETGDTNAKTEAGEEFGGFGAMFKLAQDSPSADEGTLTMVVRGNVTHSGFDNMAFLTADSLGVVEDAGDKLHGQRNALDSAYVIDLTADYGKVGADALVRFLGQGRDAAAVKDGEIGSTDGNGFQNDGDNEITGLHVSDGDASVEGLVGTKVPTPFKDGWRVFYTHQHGDNVTYEIVSAK
ncbi:alkaline phosphatase PhoX [Pleomorphomonas oryzae]|uniref:alkaline phosphatase PhoX n=1 Tax=Pleomorphomonas oryzae TaxID=261934 RepID=UPI0003FFD1E8|nr:alkaline phosphatase PhoX [Pleomorphomonas oryzae]